MSIELLNMDCMEYMAGLPDKAFDLAIIDPPYGIGENGDRNASRGKLAIAQDYKAFSGGDTEPPPVEYFSELKRVSLNQIIWGANYFTQNLPPSMGWIYWKKKDSKADFSDGELAYTSFSRALRQFEFLWSGMWQGNMLNKETRIHPTQKPVALYEWLLTNYAKPGQRILDTHLGSGSSAIAAHNLGFDFVGMELDADYYAAAVKRFEQHKAQARLFDCDDYQRTELDYKQESLDV